MQLQNEFYFQTLLDDEGWVIIINNSKHARVHVHAQISDMRMLEISITTCTN